MRIGVDIDGVLVDDDQFILDCTTKFVVENNLSNYIEPKSYEYNKFNWDIDILDEYRDKYFFEHVKNNTARRFASEVINKLMSEGHEIYIITSRYLSTDTTDKGKMMRECTKKWLSDNNIKYTDLFFSSDKIVQIKELGLDIMIEDSPETIPIFSEIVKILCFDCRYNTHLVGNNITRVYSWYDIYMKINK